jgi:hypothetical protein
MEGADEMNNEKLRSDWDVLSEGEKEEVLNAFKCAFEAIKHATIVLAETVVKGNARIIKSDTDNLTGLKDNKEGVS